MTSDNDMNGVDNFEAEMAQFDEDFDAASGKSEFEDVPDGNFNAVVAKSEMKTSKAGNPMWTLELAINGGKYHGRRLFRNQTLNSAVAAKIVKQDCTKMGVELAKYSDLKLHMAEFLDLNLDIQQKTKEPYTNIYINKCNGKHDGGVPSKKSSPIEDVGSTAGQEIFGDNDVPF